MAERRLGHVSDREVLGPHVARGQPFPKFLERFLGLQGVIMLEFPAFQFHGGFLSVCFVG